MEVHLLASQKHIEVLNLLPFKAYYHELEEDDLKNVFAAHRAVKNLKLESADVFLSMTESFVDASIGKSLGADIRAGFAVGKNAWFLNKKVPLLRGRHFGETCHELLKLFLDDVPEVPPKGFSRDLEPARSDWSENPYYLINLPVKDDEVEEQWEELFSLAEDENFVLMCDGPELDRQKEVLNDFAKKLSKKNRYTVYECANLIDFSKLALFAQSFVTGDSPLMQVAAYCGGHIHFLGQKEPMHKTGPVYFLGNVRYFNLGEPAYKEGGNIAYHKVFDELIAFMDAKAKARTKENEA